MSADNYYIIRKHPHGGFAAVMGFASDDTIPEARPTDIQFGSIHEAFDYAWDDYSEYGVSMHEECDQAWTDAHKVTTTGNMRKRLTWREWRKMRPDIEDQPSPDPQERLEGWQEAMAVWKAKKPGFWRG